MYMYMYICIIYTRTILNRLWRLLIKQWGMELVILIYQLHGQSDLSTQLPNPKTNMVNPLFTIL